MVPKEALTSHPSELTAPTPGPELTPLGQRAWPRTGQRALFRVSGCFPDASPVRRLRLKAEGPAWLSSSAGQCPLCSREMGVVGGRGQQKIRELAQEHEQHAMLW